MCLVRHHNNADCPCLTTLRDHPAGLPARGSHFVADKVSEKVSVDFPDSHIQNPVHQFPIRPCPVLPLDIVRTARTGKR